MDQRDEMLEAHVRFELARWSGAERRSTLVGEVEAAFSWLESVRVGDVVTMDQLDLVLERFVFSGPVPDALVDTVVDTVRAVHDRALQDETTVAELVARETYDRYAGAVISMREARSFLTEQVTTSEVYSNLMAHVTYQGIKNYLLTESLIARRVPGASSLMKLGQSALSAAPSLERGIDAKLTAFVNANISDSIRDSRQYLDDVVDDEMLWTIATEVWETNAQATVADLAELLSPEAADEFALSAIDAWLGLRESPSYQEAVRAAVADVLDAYADRSVADALSDVGVTAASIAGTTDEFAGTWIDRAVADGYAEQVIRARLEPFYDEYFA